ncbi:hypothetical protein, partial [Streptomyces brasiliscabiei]|uniref:hypothetical protein n=1 Tax=Streptomyces brasiliscabiei TaxID=2736302 RepID=UPI0030152E10
DWRKCFTPITNKVKLSCGQHPEQSLRQAIYRLKSAICHPVFSGTAATPDMVWRLCSGNLEGDAYNPSAVMLMEVK